MSAPDFLHSDDTSVAILETSPTRYPSLAAKIHFHKKVTADNAKHRGIHPIVALDSHNEHLAPLIAKALPSLPRKDSNSPTISIQASSGWWLAKKKPDFVSVTRGPGLFPCLASGLQTAKGLAVAWQVPLIGVNHMQAHALTPRLVHVLESTKENSEREPAFPFLTLLVSGGHTMLVHSKGLTHHSILASTTDIAIGDVIDKAARFILPEDVIMASKDVMYGRVLEKFAFSKGTELFDYLPPSTRAEELSRKPSEWGWALAAPLAETRAGSKSKAMEYSFSGLGSAVERICTQRGDIAMVTDERVDLAREVMRVAFEHLASRVVMALGAIGHDDGKITTLVVSGGVASNQFLKRVYVISIHELVTSILIIIIANYNPSSLRAFLDIRGYAHIRLNFPPPSLCTDNAAMIAWTGTEMYEAGYESELSCKAIRKWSVDPDAEDGGILGVDGWKKRP
ncbi:MAG: hypothetical protein Q9208_004528 [Pyrenodesmia sp. 3 TL-2023]